MSPIKTKVVRKGGQKRWSEKVVRKGGQKKDKKTVDTILYLIKETPNITRKVLAETIGISQSAVQKHINRLKAEHIIIRHGGDRGGYWEILQ